jgi:hypothetical protein
MRPFDLVMFDLYRMGRIERRRGVGESQKRFDGGTVHSSRGYITVTATAGPGIAQLV